MVSQRRRRLLLTAAVVLAPASAMAATASNLTASSPATAFSPSISTSGADRWVAWLEHYYDGVDHASIHAQHLVGGATTEAAFTVVSGRVLSPVVLAVDAHDSWFFWIEATAQGGVLWARQRRDGAFVQPQPVRVTTTPASFPAAALDGTGVPWVAYEAGLASGPEIALASWTGAAFAAPQQLSSPGMPSYSPQLALDTLGGLWAVWEGYLGSNYEIFARRFTAGAWGPIWQVTSPKDASGNFTGEHVSPSVHFGGSGRAWIAWVAGNFESRETGKPPQNSSWIVDRRIQMRRLEPTGVMDAVQQVPVPLSAAPIEDRFKRPDLPVVLAVRGRVMVFYRQLAADGLTWSLLMQFMNPSTYQWLAAPLDLSTSLAAAGMADPPAVADSGTGFVAVWQAGTRSVDYPAGFADPASDVWMSEVLDTELAVESAASEPPITFLAPLTADAPRSHQQLHHLGRTYTLVWGDLHEHSNLSTCALAYDQSVHEGHRAARDQQALDFYALTDHGEHQSHFDWYRSKAFCDLNNGVGGLTTLLGLEWTPDIGTGNAYGHQNVIYAGCDGELKSRDSQATPEALWASLTPGAALTIPHHTAAYGHLADLRRFDAGFNRLYEIAQARGSFECYGCIGVFRDPWPSAAVPYYWALPPDPASGVGYFQDALAMGHRMGVIASPDHTGFWGVAGAWVESRGQPALFDALSARRTLGVSNAAARLDVDFRGDGHLMGEEYALHGACPVFHARVSASPPATVVQVKLFRVMGTAPGEDGQIFQLTPNLAEASFEFFDSGCPAAGTASYYVRAVQSDVPGLETTGGRPSVAWTSPLFVTFAAGAASRNATLSPASSSLVLSPQGSTTITITATNTGDIAWTGAEGYQLVAQPGGLASSASVALAPDEYVLPGAQHAFSITLQASDATGSFHDSWQMSCPAGAFGTSATVDVTVVAGLDAGAPVATDAGESTDAAGSLDGAAGAADAAWPDAARAADASSTTDASGSSAAPSGCGCQGGSGSGSGFALLLALAVMGARRGRYSSRSCAPR